MTAANPNPERPSRFSLAMNYLPLAYLVLGAWAAWTWSATTQHLLGFWLAWIYLLPPLLSRLIMLVFGRPQGSLRQHTGAYRVWWISTQLQIPFNRFPLFEEALRLVPGLYAAWIWLWGGKVSPFAYFAPGAVITDRFAVWVERGAVIGMRSALAGHMVTRDEAGHWLITVAAPHVGAEAIVGGDAGLGPGAHLSAAQLLPYGRKLTPFATWPRPNTKDGT
jgi:hypothetical protein